MNQGRFDFRGTGLSCLWLFLWIWVLTFLTFGLFFIWAYSAQQRWISEHTYIDNRQLAFHGTGFGFFWNGVRLLLELAPDYGADHHHVRTLYAVGLLPAQTVADQ